MNHSETWEKVIDGHGPYFETKYRERLIFRLMFFFTYILDHRRYVKALTSLHIYGFLVSIHKLIKIVVKTYPQVILIRVNWILHQSLLGKQ